MHTTNVMVKGDYAQTTQNNPSLEDANMSKFFIVETKYVGPTNTRGSRITASMMDKSARCTVSYDYAMNGDLNHTMAAQELMKRVFKDGNFMNAGYADTKNGYAFVYSARY